MNFLKKSMILLASMVSYAAMAGIPVKEGYLPNGLHVVVTEDHRAPVVAIQIWVAVGGVDEPSNHTGISHALEHMMFKGTPQHPGKSMADEIAKLGGEQNAVTTSDFTFYYTVAGKAALPRILALEADRFASLTLSADDFAKEFEVIKEERRMRIEDNPRGLLYERFEATAFTASPYRRPVIGWPIDLQDMKIETLRDWYHTWYVPNNLTLVVSGDVSFKEVMTLAEQNFGSLSKKELPVRAYIKDEIPLGQKTLQLDATTEVPTVVLGYLVPVFQNDKDKDAFVLDLIGAILDFDDSGRLAKRLQRDQQVAAGIFSSYDSTGRGDTLFILGGVPTDKLDALTNALLAELTQLKTTLVAAAELDRFKTAIIAKLTYAQDDVNEKASLLGGLAVSGYPLSLVDDYQKYIQAVTPQDIQRVAKAYFTESRLTKAWMLAKPGSGKPSNLPVQPFSTNVQS